MYDADDNRSWTTLNAWLVECDACDAPQLWYEDQMLVPDRPAVAPPNQDLADDIKADYLEAGSIVGRSPRGAAALLRLALQKLCGQLGEPGKNINDDIKSLVQKGLPVQLQQALDFLRVVGNNAVHPGELDIRDDRDTAMRLFDLINLIAENRISEPKRIAAMYEALPARTRQGIQDRDSRK